MSKRHEILSELQREFERWEGHLSTLSEEEIISSRLPNGWSVKDLIAHLMAWQQVTAARLEAARDGLAPSYPEWLAGSSPESGVEIHRFNARIDAAHREWPWAQVYGAWSEGFREILRLGEELPEDVLLEDGRYPWLDGHPLIAVLEGTYRHHHEEHRPVFETWLAARGP